MAIFISFSVSINYIISQIKTVTSYLGVKRFETLSDFDRVSAIDDDKALLNILIADASLTLAATLEHRVKSWRQTAASVIFDIYLPDSADGTDTIDRNLLENLIKSYICHETIARWLNVAGESEPATAARTLADRIADRLTSSIPLPSAKARLPRRRHLPPI